jgi:heme exporter protein A
MSDFSGQGLVCRRSERIVFADLDFSVEAGGALVLVGPNGSGKSSLLRLMAGLIRPYAGQLLRNGAPVRDDPASHRMGTAYLGHLDVLKPTLTTAENVAFWAGLVGRSSHADAALARMDLAALADLPARFLSAGQRRRTALARVIACGPPLWLLDEPTLGLDARSLVALEAALVDHRAAGGMVVTATHAPIDLPGATMLDLADFAMSRPVELDAA